MLRAGLLSKLRVIEVGGNEHWCVANMRPGKHPFFNLASALLLDTKNPEKLALRKEYLCSINDIKPEEAVANLRQNLLIDIESSYQKLETILPYNHNLLISIDQFEELFHYSDEKEIEYFIQWLVHTCELKNSRIYVVITMRSEYLDNCAEYDDLIKHINKGFFQIPLLTQDNLREMIEYPAKIFDGKVEIELVNRLREDVNKINKTSRPDKLLLLQQNLVQMWLKVSNTEEKKITLECYESIGGNLVDALNDNANNTYNQFSENERKVTEILFCRLSKRDTKNKYSRHPIRLIQVASLANVSWTVVSDIVDKFRSTEQRFLFSRNQPTFQGTPLKKTDEIDITHESVIRQWKYLRDWADNERYWGNFYEYWEKEAIQHREKEGELWHGLDLEKGLDWIKKIQRIYPKIEQLKLWSKRYGDDFDLAWQFLEASKKAEDASKKEAKEAKKREVELKQKQKELQLSQENLKLSEQRKNIAFASVIICLAFSMLFWFARQNAISSQQQTEQAEQSRTESLFDSHSRHAALLIKTENYIETQQTLIQTYALDTKIANSPKHARNLLASFINLTVGKQLQQYRGAKAVLYDVAISPNKEKIVTVGERGTVILFDIKTGELLNRFDGHSSHVKSVIFDPKSKWFATAGDDKQIIIWSLSKNKAIKKLQTDDKVWALAINSTGKLLASAGMDKKITVWDTETGEKQSISEIQTSYISGLAFSPSDETIVFGSYDNITRLWQWQYNEITDELHYHTGNIQEIVFSPNGELLATSSDDKTIKIWQVDTGENIASLEGHKDKVFTIAFTKDGKYLASGSADSTIRLWDIESGVTVKVFEDHTASVTGLAIDGKYLFSSSADGKVKKWSLDLPIIDLPKPATATAISPDGNNIAIGFENGSLQCYSLTDKQPIWQQETVHKRDIQRLVFSSDNKYLAVASLDKTATIWQVKSKKLEPIGKVEHKSGVNDVTFSPDNKTLLTASYDGQMGIFNLEH